MKKLLFIITFIFQLTYLSATHNRAGEITYRQISGYLYEVTITTFTYTLSPAIRNELLINWGDDTYEELPINIINGNPDRVYLPGNYTRNRYTGTHLYPGPSKYDIFVQDPNRNLGVNNIPNSVNVVFAIKSTLNINPNLGANSTPVLLNYPIDKAAKDQLFIHNPSAFDPDGDSLSYELTTCLGEDGTPIANYILPKASDTLYVNAVTGDLVWDAPTDTGKYNIAILINEWRNGIKIGSIIRDMQIDVYSSSNIPPINRFVKNKCVTAGTIITDTLFSYDPDGDGVEHEISGGPFELTDNPAEIISYKENTSSATSVFQWKTTCAHVRSQPYSVVFKSTDDDKVVKLVDSDIFAISVIGPPVKGITAVSAKNTINLNWNAYTCDNITAIQLYRRSSRSGFLPDSCQTGIPEYLGYSLIASLSPTSLSYTDNEAGKGLKQGYEYCYIAIAIFPDGSRSIASEEVCATLPPGNPLMLKTDVTAHDSINGSIELAWARPIGIDTLPGPFKYIISRTNPGKGNTPVTIDSIITSNLNDTTYTDKNINTTVYPYIYSVAMYHNETGNIYKLGEPETTNSYFPDLTPSDNIVSIDVKKDVPWIDYMYVIYRMNDKTKLFDSIGISNNGKYSDTGLVNEKQYCYKSVIRGKRNAFNNEYNTMNESHITCSTPVDNKPPCPPELLVNTRCDSSFNMLLWTNPNWYCADDVIKYVLYFSETENDSTMAHDTIYGSNNITYTHMRPNRVAGCYQIAAVDSFNNESAKSYKLCVDECILYELPNVFTPNNDEYNNYYYANNRYGLITKIDLKIYDRWGVIVYETTDANFRWDGTDIKSNKPVTEGVYYYICDVYEPRVTGTTIKKLTGFIHVFRGEMAPINK